MYQTITFDDFARAFADCGRDGNFTYQGLRVLFDYLEELEQSTGQQIELDVIALCCEYAEQSAEDIAEDYNFEISRDTDWCDVYDLLEHYTIVCGNTPQGTFVYQMF